MQRVRRSAEIYQRRAWGRQSAQESRGAAAGSVPGPVLSSPERDGCAPWARRSAGGSGAGPAPRIRRELRSCSASGDPRALYQRPAWGRQSAQESRRAAAGSMPGCGPFVPAAGRLRALGAEICRRIRRRAGVRDPGGSCAAAARPEIRGDLPAGRLCPNWTRTAPGGCVRETRPRPAPGFI